MDSELAKELDAAVDDMKDALWQESAKAEVDENGMRTGSSPGIDWTDSRTYREVGEDLEWAMEIIVLDTIGNLVGYEEDVEVSVGEIEERMLETVITVSAIVDDRRYGTQGVKLVRVEEDRYDVQLVLREAGKDGGEGA